jgi:CubicO group peptidase (beta-lactamase class C family)
VAPGCSAPHLTAPARPRQRSRFENRRADEGASYSWIGILNRKKGRNHSNYNDLPGFEVSRKLSRETFIAALSQHPLLSPPGEKFYYSNSNFNLLGYVIEKVSGMDYWSFMARKVYDPLKMNSTRQRDTREIVRGRVTGYEVGDGRVSKRDECDLTDVFSAGAMMSTVEDLSNWVRALEKGEILTAASREKMWSPVKLNVDSQVVYPGIIKGGFRLLVANFK